MELEKAIEILNQCTNDWDELCYCVFKDTDEKDYKCIGCREKALEVVLNHLTKQEKMIQNLKKTMESDGLSYIETQFVLDLIEESE